MKKLSFFLMAMLFSVMSFAAEAKFDWSGITTTQSPTVANVYTEGDVTLTFEKASGSNIPAENKEGSIRMYKGTTLKIAVAGENNVITNVAFTCTSASYAATNLQYNGEALPSNEWALTTPAAEILLNAAANARFKSIVVTYGQVAADYIAAPAISGDVDFIESTEVSIAAGEGLKVYYTLDGIDPTNASPEYTAPFEVKETTTVKAIAYNGENASEVTTQTFTKATQVTCAEAKEIALKVSGNNVPTELTYVVKGYVTNIVGDWKSGKQSFWIADTKDGGEVFEAYYCFISKAVTLGDYVQLFGKLTKYNTIPEMADGQATILPEPAPEPVMFNVTVTAENGTVEGAGEYAENAEATLTATAAEGYEFVNWTVDGAEVSTENPYTFVVTADVALVANFKEVVIEEPLPEGVPTNAELWEAFKPYYNTYYSLARDLSHPVTNVSTFASAKMQEIMTDAASEYKWLGDYVLGVAAGQGVNLPTDMAAANEGAWRWAVHAFFNAAAGQHGAAGTDFTEAGKPQAWGPAYLAAQKPAEPATETVYFINTKKWAAVTAHAWGAKLPDTAWPGLATVKETEQIAGFDVYSFTANVGDYANVIFNNKGGGSQTPDLVWTAGKYYVIDMGWLTKEEAEAKLATPLPETWNVVGDAGLMGKGWDLNAAENAMTKQADGTYKLEKKGITITAGTYEYKAAKDHDWAVAVPQDGNQKLTISKSGIYDITFVLNVTAKKLTATATLKQEAVVIPTVIIAGDMNSWNQTKDKFTMSADSLTATFKTTLTAKSYGFKMIVGGAWLSDGKTITRAANSHKFTGANGGNSTLKADIAGEYLFTWEYATKTLTVTYPALPVKYNVTVTAENGTVTGAGEYEEGKTATLTATAAEGYEFVNWTVGDSIVSTENPYSFVVTADVALVANFKEVEPEIKWLEMDLEITNLVTEVMEVEGAKYLLLQGRDDMNDADVMLFLNNYADVDDDYEVYAESSYMTFGGLELTVLEGVMTQTSETDKGTMYNGIVRTYVAEDSLYVAFNLTMYAAPATELVITDATVEVNEDLGTLTFKTTLDDGNYMVELSGYTAPGVHEGPQICLLETPEAVAFANYVETVVADGIITLTGEFTSFMGAKFALTISGKLPVVEPVEKPEPTYTENNLNPYAFGLESKLSDDKTTLTVTYRLNNSNATSVNVVVYNGEDIVASIPGTTTIGKNTVEVATGNLPAGVELKWAVEVNGTSVAAPTQEEKIYSFFHPSGMDIDNNPENATFGMLLINEAMQSVASKTDGYVSAQFGAGIFAFTPSFDLIPNGDQPGYNGGKTFSTVKHDYAPRRIRISEDGRIFATAQDGSGEYLWEINPENLNDWTTVFQGTNDGYTLKDADGNFIAGTNSGFDVRGEGENLQLLMLSSSLPGGQVGSFKCHTYDLGTATTWATVPTKEIPGANYMLVTNQSNAQFDKDGGVWYIQHRATTTESEPGLVHINKDGVEDLKQLRHYTRNAGFRFTDDFSKVIIAGVTDGSNVQKATIYAVSQDENGAPVLTEETVIETSVLGNNLNDFAWDYAGNLYACGNSSEKLVAWAMPYSGQVETPAAAKYAFQLPEPLKMAGVVKRAVQNGDEVIVLTHEADGTAHIYQVVDGKAVAEVSQEGVVSVDPENKGSYLAISDIAVTEDGKLVANNYVRNQFAGTTPEAGYKVGTSYYYIWNDLAAAPAVWFTTQTTARSSHGDVGISFALKGTSTNAQVLTTAVHNNNRAVRLAKYNIIDGQYVEPNIPGGEQSNDYYEYYGLHTTAAYYKEATQGKQFQLSASPLGEGRWFMDGELVNPSEFVLPAIGEAYEASATLTEDLGKKYNGATYVTVGEQVLMVAPYATPEGKLTSVEILDITAGLDAPKYVDQLFIDEAVAATAAATAVEVVEGGLNITLVADAAIHTWFVELSAAPEYQVYEDAITNLVIDYDNLLLIGGPSDAFQVEVVLGLGDYDRNTDTYQLLPESSISVLGSEATFVDGYASVDGIEQSAIAVVHCTWNGMAIEFHLTMTSAPLEATKVVVENATVEIEKVLLFGDMYDYALKMTGVWHNEEDGLTYPVLVEVPVYYPEATEPSEIMSTVTVGGWGDNDPWLGFGEGTLTVTTVDGVVTATGIVQNPMAGVAIDITISGKLPSDEPVKYTVTATVNPAEAGTVEGAGEYEENTEATLIATAAEGYEFVNWTVAGEEVSTDATYTFTVTADVEVVANFKETVGSGVNNIQTGVKAVKTIKNGQLIITKDGKEYNAQGAQL